MNASTQARRQDKPYRLNDAELHNPEIVLEAFFNEGDPDHWKNILWLWLNAQLTDDIFWHYHLSSDKPNAAPKSISNWKNWLRPFG